MNSKIESGVQLFTRIGRKTCLQGINNHLFPDGGPSPNQVIKITGDPYIDKANLLIDFIVRTILPNEYNSEWKSSGVIFINTEFQINLFKIIKVIETLIKKHEIKESKKVIIENALRNLTICDCYNLEELEVTFYSLEKIIHGNENISLVLIDNIAAQYWISKFNVNMLSYYQHSQRNFETLYNAIKNLQVILIFMRNENVANKKKFSQKVDFRIEIDKNGSDFIAMVTNYEKQSEIYVPLKLEPILEYL